MTFNAYTAPTVDRAVRALVAVTAALVAVATAGATEARAAPVAAVQPVSLGFTTMSGTTSETKQVTVANHGDATLGIAIIRLADANASSFSLSGTGSCTEGTLLAPSASCTIAVHFAPQRQGTHNATLRIESNARATPDVSLVGVATPAPVARVRPASLVFSAPTGTSSDGQKVTLSNEGGATLGDIGVTVIGMNFAITASSCGATLAPGDSCIVTTSFLPTAVGSGYSATLRFSGNDPLSPTQDVALSGTGTAVGQQSPPRPADPTPTPAPDRDDDGVQDVLDSCPAVAGNRQNGCPSLLKADIRGRWRVNDRLSQLVSLTVVAPTGSRIVLSCMSEKKGACSFRQRIVRQTTRRITSLTRNFKGRRLLPAGTTIVVSVTRSRYRGTYERLLTRTESRLPRVINRCLNVEGRVQRCP